MPELPEVETIRRQLTPKLQQRTVLDAWSHPSSKFTAARETVGRTFSTIDRRGKFLLFDFDENEELVAHLGMTGKFQLTPIHVSAPPTGQPGEPNPHLRAWWKLDDGQRLEFIDIRRFGRLALVNNGDYSKLPTLHRMGPEPFDPTLDGETFWRLLGKSRQAVKTHLLSQRPIAGVGNIYADEALWLAKISPKATRLGRQRSATLLAALREVLQLGITNGGTTLRDYRNVEGSSGTNQESLNVYGRANEPCVRCGTTLASTNLQGRTTTWCRTCQPR